MRRDGGSKRLYLNCRQTDKIGHYGPARGVDVSSEAALLLSTCLRDDLSPRAEAEFNGKSFTLLAPLLGRDGVCGGSPLPHPAIERENGQGPPTPYNYHITIMFMARRDSN